MAQQLFNRGELREWLNGKIQSLEEDIQSWNAEDFLAATEDDVVDYLAERYQVTCPILDRQQVHQLEAKDGLEERTDITGRRVIRVPTTTITIAIPYQGDKDVFFLRASQFRDERLLADVTDEEIRVKWTGDPNIEPAAVRTQIDAGLDRIEQRLKSAQDDVADHNTRVTTLTRKGVSARREKLIAGHKLQADLGYPIRRRDDAPTYATPIKRKKIAQLPRPAASTAQPPEPRFGDDLYEQVVDVLVHMRNALERSPSTTAKLSETEIRDMLLVSLNGQFEGDAAGEVFNGSGKTDILVRFEDANIFIGECKFWDGPKSVEKALSEQLLRYVVWRDTKAALLLFIRGGQPTDVIKKTIGVIEGHPNYRRTVPNKGAAFGERHDFVLAANGDPEREVQLAFLPFVFVDNQ